MKKLLVLLLTLCALQVSAMMEQTAVFKFTDPFSMNFNPAISESVLGNKTGMVLQLAPNYTVTDGPVTISFPLKVGYGAGLTHNNDVWGLLIASGGFIQFDVSGGCHLISVKFAQSSGIELPLDQPGRWDYITNMWTASDNTTTSVKLQSTYYQSTFYTITVTYSSPATPLNFSYSTPNNGSTVAAFNKMNLYFNTTISKVNTSKQALLTGGSIEGSKPMTATTSGSTVTLTLSETITEQGGYTVSVPAGMFETSEGATNTPVEVNFNLVPSRDTFTPTSVDPASGSTVGKLPKVIKLTFPSFVKTGTGTVKFKIGNSSQFAGSVSVSNKVATITHSHDVTEASQWTVEIPEKMFHNDFPADDVDYRWNPTINLKYTVDGSQYVPVEPTVVTPTATLSRPFIDMAGDELVLTIGQVKKAILDTNAKPVFKYADGEKAGETVPFEGVVLTTKTNTKFDVNTTGLSAGKYTLIMPKGTFTYEVEEGEIAEDVDLTVSFEILQEDTDTPTMKAAKALLEQTGVGYPSTDSETYKALDALVNAEEVPTDEALQTAINALYNETNVTLPAVGKWYMISGVNSIDQKIWLAFNEDKTKVVLSTNGNNAAAFQVVSVSEGKVVFKTKDGLYLHVLTTLPMHEGTSDANLTETESDINKLTLAKFLASSVEGADPIALFGKFTIFGSLGTVNDNEDFAFALLNYANTAISTYPGTPLKFDDIMSSAFCLTETTEPTDPSEVTDYVYPSVGLRPGSVEYAGDALELIVYGPVETTVADATKIYYTLEGEKVAFSGDILTLTSTPNIFSVNTKGMSAGVYELVMEPGAFSYVAPTGKAVKDRALKATITIRNDGPEEIVPGDVNHDGKVDLLDYNLVCQMVRGEIPETPYGDVDGDGEVNVTDIAAIIKLILNS